MRGGNGMNKKYEINENIDQYIKKMASSGIVRSFYPNAINKALGIPLTPVLERLNRFVADDVLQMKFEIRCHEKSDIIDIVEDYSGYLNKEVYCIYCGEEVHIDLSNISPIYYINEEYQDFIKKKKKMRSVEKHIIQPKNLAMTY